MEQTEKAPSNIVVSTILLSKPGIIISVAFTGFAGMVVASKGLPSFALGFLTIVSLLLSAAGSAILNNVLDKQIDLLMNRLSKRAHALEVVGEKTAGVESSIRDTWENQKGNEQMQCCNGKMQLGKYNTRT